MGWARWFGIGALGVAGLGLGGCFVRAPVPEPFPGVAWERTYGGNGSDGAFSVQQTTDGGYIVAGWTESFGEGGAGVYLVKTDSLGNPVWQRTFGGNGYGAFSVQQTTDGGFIIAGGTDSFGPGGRDVYLVKTDASGNLEWERTFGGSLGDTAFSVQQTTDGGYIVAGWSFGTDWFDVYLVKTDAFGNLEWQRTFGGTKGDEARSVQQTTDGGYIIAGYTYSFGAGGFDVYLVKTDAQGNLVWQKTLGGSGDDVATSVQQTTDGGYIVAGYMESPAAGDDDGHGEKIVNYDVYLVKTDAQGNLEWQRAFGGSDWDDGHSVQQTSDGGYIVAGYTRSFGAGEWDVYLIKVHGGAIYWRRAGPTLVEP